MNNVIIPILTATLFTISSGSALARGGNNAGGESSGHMSTQGMDNTNGPNAADRDTGLERSEDRENTQGATHQKSGSASAKKTAPHGKGHHDKPDTDSK